MDLAKIIFVKDIKKGGDLLNIQRGKATFGNLADRYDALTKKIRSGGFDWSKIGSNKKGMPF